LGFVFFLSLDVAMMRHKWGPRETTVKREDKQERTHWQTCKSCGLTKWIHSAKGRHWNKWQKPDGIFLEEKKTPLCPGIAWGIYERALKNV